MSHQTKREGANVRLSNPDYSASDSADPDIRADGSERPVGNPVRPGEWLYSAEYADWGIAEELADIMTSRGNSMGLEDQGDDASGSLGGEPFALGVQSTQEGLADALRGQAAEDDDDDEDLNWIHGDLDEDDDDIDDNVNDMHSVAFRRREERQNAPDPTAAQVVRSNFTVIAAVIAGVTVACVKFLASFFTGSVAMFSEGVHSLVDACNDSLLLIGARASKKKPDIEHPFGFGRELYFYTFVVSVVIFFFGGGFTIYQGVRSFIAGGNVVESPIVDYLVLVIGIILEGFSFSVAWCDVKRARQGRSLMDYIRDSKSPTNFTVLLEDTAAELGMIIALLGISLSLALDIPRLDSLASIVIGALMAAIAIVLLRETRSLLIGEGLTRDEIEDVVFIVEEDPSVIKCGRVLSMYMGPNDMLLNLDVTFDDELDEGDVLQAIDRIEAELIDDFPQCSAIFVEAESLNQVYRQRHDRRQAFEAEQEDEEERERQLERDREIERELARRKAAKKKAKAKAAKKKAKKKAKKRAQAHAEALAGIEEAARDAQSVSVENSSFVDSSFARVSSVLDVFTSAGSNGRLANEGDDDASDIAPSDLPAGVRETYGSKDDR